MAFSGIEYATKCIVPKRNPSVLLRRRLLDILHSQTGVRAQVITAPAGYGKTTLLVDFAGELEVPVCWYSLDAADQDARTFIEGILASVRCRFPDFGKLTRARLQNCRELEKEIPQIIGTLTGELSAAIPDYCVFILEDCQNIESSEASRVVIDQWLERTPDNCHIIISSRTPLELGSLARLRLKQKTAEINMSQIAFTSTEAKNLVTQLYNINLTEQELEQLTNKTEGWIVGILLSTYRLRADKSQSQSLAISHLDVFRYLTTEIFDRQPEEIKSFLLISSTFEQIEPEICDSLMGSYDTLRMLKILEKDSLFLQCIDQEMAIYRYHQIFREYLQRKLLEENTETYLNLHSRAARLFEDFGRYQEAIAHYLKARNYPESARMIKARAPTFLKTGKWTTVARWIEALPEYRRADIQITLLYAQSLVYLGKADESIRILNEVLERIPEQDDFFTRATALNWRSAAYSLTGQASKAEADILAAIDVLKNHPGPPELLGDVYKRLGKRKREQSKFHAAERYLKLALTYFLEIFDLAEISDIHNSLGIIYAHLCHIEQATIHFEKARQGYAKTGDTGKTASCLSNLAQIYQRRGQFDLALETLAIGLEKAVASGYPRVQALILINQGEVLRDIEKYKDALTSYQKGLDLARDVMEPNFVAWAKAGLGETHRLLGNRDKAELLIKEAIAEASELNLSYETSLFSAQLAIMSYEKGEFKNSIRDLKNIAGRLSLLSYKDAVAKIYFHLAQATYLAGQYDESLVWLNQSTDIADSLGYDEYLTIEGKQSIALLEYAISRNVSVDRFSRVIEKLRLRRSINAEPAEATVCEQ